MSLPNDPNSLETMNTAFDGSPFIKGTLATSVNLGLMNTAFDAQPWVVNPPSTTPITTLTTTIKEYISVTDNNQVSVSQPGGSEEFSIAVQMSGSITWMSTTIKEYFAISDSENSAVRQDASLDATVYQRVRCQADLSGTSYTQIRQRTSEGFSTNTVILPNAMVPVTVATSASNPTTPTYINKGVVQYSNPATLPATDVSKAKCYVSFNCNNLIGPLSAAQIFQWGIDIGGGTYRWSTNSTVDAGKYFDRIQLFGLTGTIIDKGFEYSSSSGGVLNGGILSTRLANEQLAFLVGGNQNYFYNIPDPSLNKPPTSKYKSHADAAAAIGALAGIGVSWAIPDLPLANFQPQMTQTALQAISSLAEEAGGVLRWMGGTKYIVTYPDTQLGYWEVPDCCLIIKAGQTCSADLNTGKYNPGVYAVPQLNQYDAGTVTKKASAVTPDPVNGGAVVAEDLIIVEKLVTDQDPIKVVGLPYDYDTIYIQNVCATDGEGPYVTLDPNRFWPLQTGFAGKYINTIDVGGVLQPVLKLTPDLFPNSNSDAQNGHWYMKVQVTKKPLGGNATSGSDDDTQSRTLLRYRFIPTCVGNITCAFFGSIPLPGMLAKATLNGKTVTGIVESVSFTSPGILSVNVVQWSRLAYYQQFANFQNTNTMGV